jgi:hypothetical protein
LNPMKRTDTAPCEIPASVVVALCGGACAHSRLHRSEF